MYLKTFFLVAWWCAEASKSKQKKRRKKMTKKCSSFDTKTSTKFRIQNINGSFRWWICGLVCCLLTMLQANIHVYNFTVLCMQNSTKFEQDLLFSAAHLAPLPFTFILYFLTNLGGVKKTVVLCSFISFFSTILFPLASDYGFWFMWIARFFQGLPSAIFAMVISVITSHYSTLAENGVFVSILAAYYQLAPLLTMPLSATMCTTTGWSSIYYVHGALTAFFTICFIYLFTDKAADNGFVSKFELEQIEMGKTLEEKAVEKAKTPFIEIHKDSGIWAIWLTSIGGTIGFSIFLQYGPTYLNKVLHYNLSTTGWSAAIPYIFSFFARILGQPLSSNCTFLGERLAAIISTTISQGTMALCFLILIFIPQDWNSIGQLCYSLVIVANGLNGVGIVRSAQLVAKQHMAFVCTMRSFYRCLVGLLLPILVNLVAPNDTHQEWNKLFIIIFVIVFLTNLIFIIFARAEAAPWTMETTKPETDLQVEAQFDESTTKKF